MGRVTRVGGILAGESGNAYDLQEARALPYAAMDVKLGLSLHALVILRNYSGQDLHWATADRITLVTRNGRIVETGALPEDLVKTQFWTPDPIVDRLPAEGHSVRLVDLEHRALYGLAIDSQWKSLGFQNTQVLDQVMYLEEVVETCKARQFDWEFENRYWRDENKVVWSSEQYYTPGIPNLVMTVIRQG